MRKPVPVAIGIVALYLLVAVELSSLVMTRLPRRLWRAIHLTSFVVYWLAAYHFLTAGTDAANPVLRAVVVTASCAVLFLTFARVLLERRAPVAAARRSDIADIAA